MMGKIKEAKEETVVLFTLYLLYTGFNFSSKNQLFSKTSNVTNSIMKWTFYVKMYQIKLFEEKQ